MIKFNYEIRTNIWKLNWTKRFPFFNSDFNKLQVLLVKYCTAKKKMKKFCDLTF